jgi:hypothetical protein
MKLELGFFVGRVRWKITLMTSIFFYVFFIGISVNPFEVDNSKGLNASLLSEKPHAKKKQKIKDPQIKDSKQTSNTAKDNLKKMIGKEQISASPAPKKRKKIEQNSSVTGEKSSDVVSLKKVEDIPLPTIQKHVIPEVLAPLPLKLQVEIDLLRLKAESGINLLFFIFQNLLL